jgi:hypothetical protein
MYAFTGWVDVLSVLQVAEMCRTSTTFKDFLADPSVPKKKKSESIMALMKELKFTDTTVHLFGTHPTTALFFVRFAKRSVLFTVLCLQA